MADTTPASSLPPVSSVAGSTAVSHGSQASNGSYAFLIHSQHTLPHNLPPNVDNKPLARQKRRRTSPEDQAVLEAEYRKNPKPDKASRMDIVSRVALGEKEVQIWFQNRRQSTRRKSRPVELHEMIQSPRSSLGGTSTMDLSQISIPSSDDQNNVALASSSQESRASASSPDQDYAPEEASNAKAIPESSLQSTAPSQSTEPTLTRQPSQSLPSSQETTSSQQTKNNSALESGRDDWEKLRPVISTPRPESFRPITAGLGYISNRRNAPFQSHSHQPNDGWQQSPSSSQGTPIQPGSAASSQSSRSLKRSTSSLRMSMSIDGKAQVVANDGDSPPPESPGIQDAPQRRSDGLQRSQSAIGLNEIMKRNPQGAGMPFPRRTPSGRSRDARTWEFYCDSGARNALSAKAEQERSGSAVNAIGLLRSRSSNMLTQNSNKRNAQLSRQENIKRVKPSSTGDEKPKLVRASSSLARLQNVTGAGKRQLLKIQSKFGSKPVRSQSPSSDSDKENRVPGTHVHAGRRRGLPRSQIENQGQRSVLRENNHIPSHSTSLGATLARNNQSASSSKIPKPSAIYDGDDDEIAQFMGSSNVPREEEDLDAVQNLLSLSQGNWR
ncbi:hypothetical protein L228DRAFT_282347 [Xylona heveae TC161]|uniref:Homeobox domain-containing protein n=1 Tax=Xylona heveae (strain CBS 132557 / TC161) TaxID=1328760 RepID=A0A161TCV7_XYLHT|nr:hypothetical protein L228DRAFT_282347 [Xylona heveae TC161]KZF23647.1 hypothetical protein L228DRAFT_282347 [Xylona heveae TC161]